jgi:hypothetical protein
MAAQTTSTCLTERVDPQLAHPNQTPRRMMAIAALRQPLKIRASTTAQKADKLSNP